MADDPIGSTQDRLGAGIVSMYEKLRAVLHPEELARSTANLNQQLEGIESDLADFIRPFITDIADHPDTDPKLADAMRTMAAPVHQSQLALVFAGVYALVRQLVDAAIAPYAQLVGNNAFSVSPTVPLSPAQAALAVVKDKVGKDWAELTAKESGIHPNVFDIMVEITGEPISIQEALLLYRRKQIDDTRLHQIVAESRVKLGYYNDIKNLRYAPPSVGEVIAGRLKNHLTEAEYLDKLENAGMHPSEGSWLLATAGRPYGPTQALELWNRGEISEGDVDQVIAQSDINPDFGPDFKKLRRYLPPPRSVVPLLRSGAITESYARQLLEMHGLNQTDADAFVREATMTKTSPVKELSATQAVKLYQQRMISRADAAARLGKLNYPPDEIELLLDAADAARHIAYVEAVVRRVHARYVASKLTRAEAVALLTKDGVPNDAISDYLTLWELERDANHYVLTPSAIVGAYRREEIDAAETRARLLSLGVQPNDLAILIADGWPPTKPPSQAIIDAVVNG